MWMAAGGTGDIREIDAFSEDALEFTAWAWQNHYRLADCAGECGTGEIYIEEYVPEEEAEEEEAEEEAAEEEEAEEDDEDDEEELSIRVTVSALAAATIAMVSI